MRTATTIAPLSGHEIAAVQQLRQVLDRAPAYHALGHEARREFDRSLARIQQALASGPGGAPRLAGQMAPDLRSQLAPGGDQSGLGSSSPSTQTSPGLQPAPAPAPAPAGSGPVGRVGEVARATLNAIDFPTFVASLIQGTFQAIVDASIQQMEAYAELLKNVAGTVDRFMADNVTDGQAKDYLADQYSGVLGRDTSSGAAKLVVNQTSGELPSFFKDLGLSTPDQLDEQSINEVVVPATRRQMAERRQQTLATMVLMGINRVVVKDGEISAKLMFHIDATESTNIKFDQNKVTSGNMSGTAGRNPFGATSVMVNTTSLNAQSAINVRADLTGQVTVRFASETFPLERFADSAAIQLINNNAKVPAPAAPPGAVPGTPAVPAAPVVAAPALPAPTPATPAAPKIAGQGLALTADPWAPVGAAS
ncbi:hypothetical protein H8N03_16195 [Ramlibacter sp. USB13]|uniref:Uncharacterized protein n=1 Tax=Ramlibacter cellulosilyticus TaxID=2764187 RepID=A0A923MS60_9BURK|nr:hypothetical protein [Ramlibacter cellulosilyticus]MBC5784490.1 hypothetical protein [Ramlibacter cellulosilyticus]